MLIENNERFYELMKANSKINTRTQEDLDIYQDYILYLLENGIPDNIKTEEDAVNWIELRLQGQIRSKLLPLEKSIETCELIEECNYYEEDDLNDVIYDIINEMSGENRETLEACLYYPTNRERAELFNISRQAFDKRFKKAIIEAKKIVKMKNN
ncbi:MAG: hypothetical protein N4A40_09860 [Tissierellales bacterium]|nr:hypothetical protein [Tissierellales bacterium]